MPKNGCETADPSWPASRFAGSRTICTSCQARSSGRGGPLAGLLTRLLLGLLRSDLRAFGAASLGSAPLIVPPLKGFLAWVVRTLRMLADHGVQLRAGLKPQWRSLRSPIEAGFSAPLRWDSVVCRQALARGHFRTPIPSLCHSAPGGLALRVACKFGHKLAFSGVFQKFLRRMHRGHYAPWCPDPLSQSPYTGVTEKGKESSPNA